MPTFIVNYVFHALSGHFTDKGWWHEIQPLSNLPLNKKVFYPQLGDKVNAVFAVVA